MSLCIWFPASWQIFVRHTLLMLCRKNPGECFWVNILGINVCAILEMVFLVKGIMNYISKPSETFWLVFGLFRDWFPKADQLIKPF